MTTKDKTLRALLYCREPQHYSGLVSKIAKHCSLTITCDLNKVGDLVKIPHHLVMLEIPDNKEKFIVTVKRIIKENPKTKVILLNGNINNATLAKAFHSGVCDYFPKPVDLSLLAERIGVLLNID